MIYLVSKQLNDEGLRASRLQTRAKLLTPDFMLLLYTAIPYPESMNCRNSHGPNQKGLGRPLKIKKNRRNEFKQSQMLRNLL